MNNIYFPDSKEIKWDNGVTQYSSKREGKEVLISYVPPNTKVPPHKHKELQIGMVIKGELEMNVGDKFEVMKPLNSMYVCNQYIEHHGENNTNEEVIAVDIKFDEENDFESRFIEVYKTKELFPGMEVSFFVDDWVELMIASIPKDGGKMPQHKHKNYQVGICIDGEYDMYIEDEHTKMTLGQVYFCDSKEAHSAINQEDNDSKSINVFTPPRYNRFK
ncbi:cupin domain-containing protein [Staphylococcus saprophyticus]|uniref:cupin domain-containing protein n=1 Tax=Staphylococcus saprophyticus TaxID=29385 RepID=UPI0028A0BFB4|nr:cupin domain-containing protein [Staphylococcus saprophyticus]